MPTDYTPRALTIARSTVDPDRYALTYEAGNDHPTEAHDLVTWHDAILALEFQRPSWRRTPLYTAPHPAAVEILNDVRNAEDTGVAAVTISAEPRTVA